MHEIRLREFIWALSAATDLVGVTDISHGRRVAFYANQIARELAPGFPWPAEDIITAALLHDCGVSSTDAHERLVREMEWSHASEHCTRGAELLVRSALLRRFAGPVRLHHTRWSIYTDARSADDDGLLGNLIFLADRLDVMIANQPGEILLGSQQILKNLTGYSGKLFNPEYVRALQKAARSESFWQVRADSQLLSHFEAWLELEPVQSVDPVELNHLFGLFGLIVDGKSRYTGAHSKAVGELSFQIARKFGLADAVCYRLGLAGLVHDIGKLRVPDAILNKPRDLDEAEYSTIKRHSFDALDILSHLSGFEDVAQLSAKHHERLDGSGYPHQLNGAELTLEARILAIADIFQALAQNRPYRKGMQDDQIKCVLELEASRGKIDPAILKTVMEHFAELLVIARQQNLFGS